MFADRFVLVPILIRVTEAQLSAVRQIDDAGALNLQKETIDRIDIANFQALPAQRAFGIDLFAREVRHQL